MQRAMPNRVETEKLSMLVSMATPAQFSMARPDGDAQGRERFTRKTTYVGSSGVRA